MIKRQRGGFAGLSEMIDELQRLASGPDAETISRLDAVLASAAAYSQSLVHVHTGALKASMTVRSSYDESLKVWEGEIRYSDPAANWEMRRGGTHSQFIDDLPSTFEDAFESAIVQHFAERG